MAKYSVIPKRSHRLTLTFFPTLVIMVKTPKMGHVKTRLAKHIGAAQACCFYRSLCTNVIARLSAETRWRTVLAVAPDTDVMHPFWFPHVTMAQSAGDLGQKMQHVFESLPPGPAVIIGTDIPEIQQGHIADAFDALGCSDIVLGPADDGGYWLVGQKRVPRILSIFENVRWSSQFTLADTMRNCEGYDVVQLNMLRDVDTVQDYNSLKHIAERRILPHNSS